MSGREWTTEQLTKLYRWVMETECGYCLDGADEEALPCPECGFDPPAEPGGSE